MPVKTGYHRSLCCKDGTRQSLLNQITVWVANNSGQENVLQTNAYWLYGSPGIGKTSLAHSICATLHKRNHLAGTFFCQRDDPNLSNPINILPTFIHELAIIFPPFRTIVAKRLRDDPNLTSQSMRGSLFLDLIRSLPRHPEHTLVFVIDAFDECGDAQSRPRLLRVLTNAAAQAPWLKIIITSKTEVDIQHFFGTLAQSSYVPYDLQRGAIPTAHPERERHVAAVREAGRAGLEELRSELEGAQYALAVVNSPTRLLPYELMAEIFDWHMLMGGTLAVTLLVCKWWTMVVYTSPRLWARITVTNRPRRRRYIRGSVVCTDYDYLRLVLSRSRYHPLQLELAFMFDESPHGICRSTSSLTHGPRATNNRTKAIKLILDGQILRRCTSLVLANDYLPFDHLNTTVLPLLSSIQNLTVNVRDRELRFVQSLVNLSPALRHIRCSGSLSAENQGVGLWTRRIKSYVRIRPSDPCYFLHESPSLRRLEVYNAVATPLTLPALQILRWHIVDHYSLPPITAPRLHTLIVCHKSSTDRWRGRSAGSISLPNLRVAIHTAIYDPKDLYMFHTPALEHLTIEYRSSTSSRKEFLELFDGWIHMPKPKSLYLDCTFHDDALVNVLGRLPCLEVLRIAGTGLWEAFWRGLTPSYKSIRRVSSLPNTHTNENATHILVPKLKVLLVCYPTVMRSLAWRNLQEGEAQFPNYDPPDVETSWRKEHYTVRQASTVAVARERAGYPLSTLACWSPGWEVEVLIGSLDGLPDIPQFVSLTALWCY